MMVDDYPRVSKVYVVRESFSQHDLTVTNEYDLDFETTRTTMAFGIINKSKTDELSFIINEVTILVPPFSQWYDEFEAFTSVSVAGDNLDFDAYVKG